MMDWLLYKAILYPYRAVRCPCIEMIWVTVTKIQRMVPVENSHKHITSTWLALPNKQ